MNELEQKYEKLIKTLNIPSDRTAVNEQNIRWFLRSGAIVNMNKQNCHEAITVAKQILNQQ